MLDKIKDLIARAYYALYCRFLQRPPNEPFTKQAARFEQKYPSLFWLGWLAVMGVSTLHTINCLGWWRLILIPLYLAASWWFHHILQYRVDHPENVPYKANRLFNWSARRMGLIK